MALLQPHLGHRAQDRPVVALDRAAEAEQVLRVGAAHDRGHDRGERGARGRRGAGHGVRARGVRAELEVRVAGDVAAHQELVEARHGVDVDVERGAHEGVGAHDPAVLGHAHDVVLALLADLARDVRGPAVRAERVPAHERERLGLRVVEADGADSRVHRRGGVAHCGRAREGAGEDWRGRRRRRWGRGWRDARRYGDGQRIV